YSTDQSVAIGCATPDAIIYYTIDGSTPTITSAVYANPIPVAGNGTTLTIKAVAVKTGMTNSPVASSTYTIIYTQNVAVPTFTPPAGVYNADQSVTIQCTTVGAIIYYTIDGSTPTTASAVYANPIPVAGNGTALTIKAMAVKAGMPNSDIASASYTINTGGVAVLFSYPASASGGLIRSSWVSPDGSDADFYAYNDFTLPTTRSITEVRWRGGYLQGGAFGPANDFTVTFFATNVTGAEPLVTLPESSEISLVKYRVGGNAGETVAGTFGGVLMYDYRYQLPTPFQAVGGTKYWVRIEAFQTVAPDWGIAVGTGGDGVHFRYDTGSKTFRYAPNDTSFTLLGQ
ncbi:MAG: chitobiase/beta-hexosaminidase C-terminal domain-containing protein, partial [Proteobacteria bacterium]|nr:chitobiase/beta-hexosaminidase C-terminal domain-containing protein [Pseudomonadota bacterium]